MKLIIAIIQSHKLDDVMRELDEKEIYLKTVTNVLGCGRQKGVTEVYRGVKEVGTLLKKVRLEIGVNDAYVKPAVDAIVKGAPASDLRRRAILVLGVRPSSPRVMGPRPLQRLTDLRAIAPVGTRRYSHFPFEGGAESRL